MSVAEDIVFEEHERACVNNGLTDLNVDLKAFLSKLTPATEIVLVLQKRDECGGVYTTLRIEGHPDHILEMCGNTIDGYFITITGMVYGVYGTKDFVIKAVKEEKINENNN